MHTSTRGLIAAMFLAGSALASPAFAQESSAAGTTAQVPSPSDAVAATPPVPAAFTITGAATIASQYRFRGISQSNNRPVVQGTFTVAHSSGLYISTWGSSASAGDSPIQIGGTEIDVYGGYTHELGHSGFTIDVGGYGYIYPGATAGNYYEVYGNLSKTYGPFSAKVGLYYAPDQKAFDFLSGTNHNAYVYGELSAGIPSTPVTIHTHLGHTGGGFDYGKQYLDFNAGVTYKWKALAFDISVVGTDLSRKDIYNGFGCGSIEEDPSACTTYFRRPAKTVAVGSITASF
jgi:uncharacterized protein (TIGR02001 family)